MSASEKQGVLARVLDAIRGRSAPALEVKTGAREERGDGWVNFTTGAGTSIDKTLGTRYAPIRRLDDVELESLYYGDDICARAVDDRAEEMFRRGYKLEATQKDDVTALARALCLNDKLRDLIGWGNLYGGSGMVLGVDDGQDPTMPLNLDRVRAIRFLNVVDRRYLRPLRFYDEPLAPKFGEPMTYNVTPQFGGGALEGLSGVEVHESRIIVHRATRIDTIAAKRLDGWSYSVLQRPYDIIRQFANSYTAAGQLMYDAGQAVFKVTNLMQVLSSSHRQKFLDRMLQVEMSRYTGRPLVIDKDGEDFHRDPVQIAGVADLLDRFMMRLAASLRIPVTRLMGRSPAGMNATGASDEQAWYDSVKLDQVKKLEPKVFRFCQVATAGKWDGKSGESANGIEWARLEEPDDEEAEKVEGMRATRYKTYYDMGSLTGEQVAAIEFLKKPIGDVVDEVALMQAIKDDNELLKNPPKPPPPNLAGFTGAPPQLGQGTPPPPGSPGAPPAPPPPAEGQ